MKRRHHGGLWITVATVLCSTLLLSSTTKVSAQPRPGRPAPEQTSDLKAAQGLQWEKVAIDEPLSHAFLQAVGQQIQAAITGAYGGTPLYENAKVVEVRRLKTDPTVVEVDVRVDTFYGAHNPLGTVTIVFRVTSSQLYVGEVKTTRKN
jgi:hypothetical protein